MQAVSNSQRAPHVTKAPLISIQNAATFFEQAQVGDAFAVFFCGAAVFGLFSLSITLACAGALLNEAVCAFTNREIFPSIE
jgi:hypothetical protein